MLLIFPPSTPTILKCSTVTVNHCVPFQGTPPTMAVKTGTHCTTSGLYSTTRILAALPQCTKLHYAYTLKSGDCRTCTCTFTSCFSRRQMHSFLHIHVHVHCFSRRQMRLHVHEIQCIHASTRANVCTCSHISTTAFHSNFLYSRYIYCPKCFSEIQGDTVTVGDDPLSATRIPKSQFKELKNNAIDREP